jgi:hypothetical protein
MRATATGLAAVAVLGLAGALAHADPFPGYPPGAGCEPCNPGFYTVNGQGCRYGPNYCFRGPCLPPSPFNGMLPFRERGPGQAPGMGPGMPPGYGPPGGPSGPPGFCVHPFAHGPRDFFMYGQTTNDW